MIHPKACLSQSHIPSENPSNKSIPKADLSMYNKINPSNVLSDKNRTVKNKVVISAIDFSLRVTARILRPINKTK